VVSIVSKTQAKYFNKPQKNCYAHTKGQVLSELAHYSSGAWKSIASDPDPEAVTPIQRGAGFISLYNTTPEWEHLLGFHPWLKLLYPYTKRDRLKKTCWLQLRVWKSVICWIGNRRYSEVWNTLWIGAWV
jgi:hypothetical protein